MKKDIFDNDWMHWLFVMLSIKEIAGKFRRLKRYLEEAEIGLADRQRRLQFLDYLTNSIQDRNDRLERLWRVTSSFIKHYPVQEAVTLLVTVTGHVRRFKDLHEGLCWFFTPWVEAETDIFLRDSFDSPEAQEQFEALNNTVGFTEQYDFIKSYHTTHSSSRQPSNPNVIALPNIEKNNPLMWPILMHEVGHSLVEAREIDKELENKIRSEPSTGEAARTLEQWGVELAAHLMALRILGPSYLLAYLNFYTFTFHDPENSMYAFRRDSTNTPSPDKRISFLREALKEMDHRFIIEGEVLDTYLNLYEIRLNLEAKKCKYDIRPQVSSEGTEVSDSMYKWLVCVVKDKVSTALSKLGLQSFSYDVGFNHAQQLCERLKDRELISSRRVCKSVKEDIERELSKEPPNLEATCESLREEPCKSAEIINAGWLKKIKRELEETFSEVYFRSEEARRRKISLTEEVIDDEYGSQLLQKSIELAAIHRFYSEGGKTLSETYGQGNHQTLGL